MNEANEVKCVVKRREDGNMYFGKDCPKGMVQVEFVGCSPKNRIGDYGWKPEERAFHDGIAKRRGLHIVHPLSAKVEKTSANACSVFFDGQTGENYHE